VQVLQRTKDPLLTLAFSPDGNLLAVAGERGRVWLWDLAAGELRHELKGFGASAKGIAFTPDGRQVVAGGPGAVLGWDAATGELVAHAWRNTSVLEDFALSLDGRLAVVAARSGGVDCLKWPEGRKLWHLKRTEVEMFYALAFAPDGGTLALGGFGKVQLREAATGKRLSLFRVPSKEVKALAFAPDGSALACAAENHLCVKVLVPRSELRAWKLGRKNVQAVAWHPTGRALALASNDGTVRVWETANWSERAEYDWQVGPVQDVAFSRDGLKAACCGRLGKVVVWDVDG
jgi:WD40 repeat protein